MRRVWLAGLLLAFQSNFGVAETIPQGTAVALAEKFVVENGYTTSPPEIFKSPLDPEMWDSALTHNQVLKMRFNTLKPKAIGAKPGGRLDKSGWSVAFDYVPGKGVNPGSCRVVEINRDGTKIWMVHEDGMRNFFAGLDLGLQ
jgi:hypothetical protein